MRPSALPCHASASASASSSVRVPIRSSCSQRPSATTVKSTSWIRPHVVTRTPTSAIGATVAAAWTYVSLISAEPKMSASSAPRRARAIASSTPTSLPFGTPGVYAGAKPMSSALPRAIVRMACVCTFTKPGVMTRPRTSSVRVAARVGGAALAGPTNASRSPQIAMTPSSTSGSASLTVSRVAPRRTRSAFIGADGIGNGSSVPGSVTRTSGRGTLPPRRLPHP